MNTTRRGFTLIELLISMTITLVAVGAAMAVLSAQNISFSRQSGQGAAVAQSELALDTLERAIRLAGTGIDPQFAFDFDFYGCALPGGTLNAGMTESAGCGTFQRDAVAAPDELVVAYRDPGYSTTATPVPYIGCPAKATGFIGKAWGVRLATPTSVTLAMKPGDTIYRGQILQIVCDDAKTYLYATVNNSKVAQPSTGTTCNDVTLTVYGTIANDPFNQPSTLNATCFSNGNARAFAVRRQRFFIHRDLTDAIPHPYLMLDQGLDLNDDGLLTDADLLPVAADIEDLQVAYGLEQAGIRSLATPPNGWVEGTYVVDGNDKNGVWGDDPTKTTPEQLSEPLTAGNPATAQFAAANSAHGFGPGLNCVGSASTKFYQYPCLLDTLPVEDSQASTIHGYRWIAWPGNIATVQVGVIARAPIADPPDTTAADQNVIPALFNRPAQGPATFAAFYNAMSPLGHKRVTAITSVRPVNMAVRNLYWN